MEKIRTEVDEKYKWDLTDIYISINDWMNDYNKIDEKSKIVLNFKGKIYENSNTLYNFLIANRELDLLLNKLNFYAFLHLDEDITNEESNKIQNLINAKLSSVSAELSFIESELIKNGSMELINKYIEQNSKLKDFQFYLEKALRFKEHTLDEQTQSIVSSYDEIIESFDKASNFLRVSEMDYGEITLDNGEKVKLTSSNIKKYIRDNSREVRRQTYENREKAYETHINTLATNYIGHIKTDELIAKLKNYSSSIDSKFFGLNINKKVYDRLISAARKHKDIYQKYIELYKRVLNVENLEPYDLSARLAQNSNKQYSVEDAQNIIKKAYAFYGDYYIDILDKAFSKHWIDYVPNKNKPSGWYSAYVPNNEPRISANFDGKMNDISSLCHELGHLANQYMSVHNLMPEYVYNSAFCAEVVSLNNEAILALTYESDDIDDQILLLGNFIEIFAGNFFGAVMGAMFEEQAHDAILKGTPLTSKTLNEIYRNIVLEFDGNLIKTPSEINWARIPHFFNSFYYFSYATGITAATALSNKLLNNENNILEKFKKYLKTGGSIYPLDALKIIDIDMEDEQVFDKALETFDKALEKFNTLLDKKSK